MKISLKNLLPKSSQTRQNILIVFLIVLSLAGFVFFYESFFNKPPESPNVDQPKSISGRVITSQEVSESVINKIKNDIKKMQEELNNPFYSKLRNFEPFTGTSTIDFGRDNPFSL
ncbi:hypothetical protein HY249_03130 [Candidatus Azambacteria bacterium]|nr:hypothetical protein [Candidatus Azambacteria bacterium]